MIKKQWSNLESVSTLVLTPNSALAITLHKQYQQDQIQKQCKSWLTPDILSAASWIRRCFNRYTSTTFNKAPLLLNTLQEQRIWENIIEHAHHIPLLPLSKTAEAIKAAHRLLKEHQLDLQHPLFQSTEVYSLVHYWFTQFANQCAKKNWIDAANLTTFITEKIKEKEIDPPSHIYLARFILLSPQLKTLLSACEEIGSTISCWNKTHHPGKIYSIALPTQEDEIRTMARWAKSRWQIDKKITIGCALPTLYAQQERVQQLFSEIFEEENSFSIAVRKKLIDYPLIYTALQLLGLSKRIINIETIHYILLSPFVGDAESELTKRGLLDQRLRYENYSSIDLTQCATTFTPDCPLLVKRISSCLSLLDSADSHATLSYFDWATRFNQLLTAWGWPGERKLNILENQLVQHWMQLLNDFASIEHIAKPVSLLEAIDYLHGCAEKTHVTLPPSDAPIQIVELTEAAILPFDYLWIAGMDDLSWPAPAAPNPYLPKTLQQLHGIPHTTPESELAFCRLLTHCYQDHTQEVIFSYAEKNAEWCVQISPLLRDVSPVPKLHLTAYQTPSVCIYQSRKIETLQDEIAPPIQDFEKIKNSVNSIKQQALCPFKAFAECRLHAEVLECNTPGLRTKDRGSILHKILELVWNQLKDQATLLAMEETTLSRLISECINQAIWFFPFTQQQNEHYITLEKQRLYQLIEQWLQIEKKRPFFTVLHHEKKMELQLNQHTFSLRIDRIDLLSNHEKLIIDYKSGKYNKINQWFGERPEEPQLPLYALLYPEKIAGISFAQITANEYVFKGMSQHVLDMPGIKVLSEIKTAKTASWHEQLTDWNMIFTQLSDHFYQGQAQVDPKEPEQTCSRCTLQSLCRIQDAI